MNPSILLTFDIEDWFQVENFKPYIPFSTWQNRELRVEKNTHKLLDLLDQESNQPTNDNAPRTRPPRLSSPVTARHGWAGESDGGQATDNTPEITTPFPRSGIGSDHFHPESDPDNNKSQKSSKSCLTE